MSYHPMDREVWDQSEYDFLAAEENYAKPWPVLAAKLGRKVDAVRERYWVLLKLGKVPKRPRIKTTFHVWTPERDAYLIEHINDQYSSLCAELYVSMPAIQCRLKKLRVITGLPLNRSARKRHPRGYSDRDDALIMSDQLSMTIMQSRLGRTEQAIRARRSRINKLSPDWKPRPVKVWTKADEDFIFANWPRLSMDEIGSALGRSRCSIAGRLKRFRDRGVLCLKKGTTRQDVSKGSRRLNRHGASLPSFTPGGQRSASLLSKSQSE